MCRFQDQPINFTKEVEKDIGSVLNIYQANYLRLKPALYNLHTSMKTIEAADLIIRSL